MRNNIEPQQITLFDAIQNRNAIERERERERVGIPLGNLTSQLFANIYLNELDQFIKHQLGIKYYLRYADDFLVLSNNIDELKNVILPVQSFLENKLKLEVHPDKISIRKLRQGLDFCGYIVLPHHIVLQTKTKRRMLKRVNQIKLPSYLGLLKHCNGYKLEQEIGEIVMNKI